MNHLFYPSRWTWLVMLAGAIGWVAEPVGGQEWVTPLKKYSGIQRPADLAQLAPQSGVIVTAEQLKKVWSGWAIEQPLPEVDFSSQLVLVTTVPGPNRTVSGQLKLEQGDLTYQVAATQMAGPGFGYLLMVVPSAGVETINGQPVPVAPKTAPPPPAIADQIEVAITGSVATGLMAIGGETTGSTITAQGVTWELDFQNADQFQMAEQLASRSVKAQVTGLLNRIEGIEVKTRWIVTVRSIQPARPPAAPVDERSPPENPRRSDDPAGGGDPVRMSSDPTPGAASQPSDVQAPANAAFKSIKIEMSGGRFPGKLTQIVEPNGVATVDDGAVKDSYQLPQDRLDLLHDHIQRTDWAKVPRLNRSNQSDATGIQIEIRTQGGIHRLYVEDDRIKDVPEIAMMFRLLRK